MRSLVFVALLTPFTCLASPSAHLLPAAEPLTVEDAPMVGSSAVLSSVSLTLAGVMTGGLYVAASAHGSPRLSPAVTGIAISASALMVNFGPNFGDLLSGNPGRFFARGGLRALLLGLTALLTSLAATPVYTHTEGGTDFYQSPPAAAVVPILGGALWLSWSVFDIVDSRHAPDRWLAIR